MYVPDKDYEDKNTTSPTGSPTETNNKEKEQDIVKSKNDGHSSSSTVCIYFVQKPRASCIYD